MNRDLDSGGGGVASTPADAWGFVARTGGASARASERTGVPASNPGERATWPCWSCGSIADTLEEFRCPKCVAWPPPSDGWRLGENEGEADA